MITITLPEWLVYFLLVCFSVETILTIIKIKLAKKKYNDLVNK